MNFINLGKTLKLVSLCAFFAMLLCGNIAFAQTTLISSTGDGGLETAGTIGGNNWIPVNSTQSFFVGTAAVTAPSLGTNMAYASLASGSWTSSASSSVAHIYRDINIPVGEPIVTITLKYKTLAVDATFDFLKFT